MEAEVVLSTFPLVTFHQDDAVDQHYCSFCLRMLSLPHHPAKFRRNLEYIYISLMTSDAGERIGTQTALTAPFGLGSNFSFTASCLTSLRDRTCRTQKSLCKRLTAVEGFPSGLCCVRVQ